MKLLWSAKKHGLILNGHPMWKPDPSSVHLSGCSSVQICLSSLKPVCMTLPGGGLRLQTLGRLAAQLFDSTLRTLH
jgi:hypothetical protein